MKPMALLITVLLLTVTPTFAQRKESRAEAALRTADAKWEEVFSAKDLEGSVGFCAPNGSVMAPNTPIATGKEAITQLFTGLFGLPGFKINWKATGVEVARSGEIGYTTGIFELGFKDPSGKAVHDKGKYVTVWKKQADGSWKVIRDIFNSDLAPAP